MPNPLSWFFHHLPRPLHRVEVVGNFFAQLILPFGLFLPQPFASVAAILMILTQLYLVVSGNYAWLNWLTILACVAGIADPAGVAAAGTFAPTPMWFEALVLGMAGLVAMLSWWPIRNMASPGQAMNASFNPFHIVNTYGAFGAVGRTRYEVVVEGAADERAADDDWREYGFKGKPGEPSRVPRQVAPYHYRLDWQIWFIPLSPLYRGDWFLLFLVRLLENDQPTLRLLRRNPFPDGPPALVRARLFHYRYSTWRELRETDRWWVRTPVEEFIPPFGLGDVSRASRSPW
jgi:Lipase maturation factor